MVYDEKSAIILILFLLEVVCLFLHLLSRFCFTSHMNPAWRSLSFIVLFQYLSLFLENIIFSVSEKNISQIISVSIFSFQTSDYICQAIQYCPTALGCSILFLTYFLFLFPFQFSNSDYTSFPSSLLILSLTCLIYCETVKAIHSVTVFLILSFPFLFHIFYNLSELFNIYILHIFNYHIYHIHHNHFKFTV